MAEKVRVLEDGAKVLEEELLKLSKALKLSEEEVRELKKLGELPMDLEVVEKVENEKSGLEIAFNKDKDD